MSTKKIKKINIVLFGVLVLAAVAFMFYVTTYDYGTKQDNSIGNVSNTAVPTYKVEKDSTENGKRTIYVSVTGDVTKFDVQNVSDQVIVDMCPEENCRVVIIAK